jgi:mediator of RNA polymerase II transcription subunit 8
MDKEDKLLEGFLDSLISKANDVKESLSNLLFKLENEGSSGERIDWTSALDSYSLISSQMNIVMRLLKADNMPNLRNRVLLPLVLNPERDEQLCKLTEGRVQAFDHEMVPSYLRSKNEPEIERMEKMFQSKAATIAPEQGQKAMNQVNKIVMSLSEQIKNWREEESGEVASRSSMRQTFNNNDTNSIILAINLGKGFKGDTKGIQQQQPPPATQQQQQQGNKGGGKAPPTIKTNIRAAPYQRN